MIDLHLSKLGKTWIFDIDGTIVKHNGYKIDGHDTLLDGAKEFFSEKINNDDIVVLITSRKKMYQEQTENFLKANNIRFDYIIYEAPYGERIIINDNKPSGLTTAISIPTERDQFLQENIIIDENL